MPEPKKSAEQRPPLEASNLSRLVEEYGLDRKFEDKMKETILALDQGRGSLKEFFQLLEGIFPDEQLSIRSFQKLTTYAAFSMQETGLAEKIGHFLTLQTFKLIRLQENISPEDFQKKLRNFWFRQISRAVPVWNSESARNGRPFLDNKVPTEIADRTIYSDFGSFSGQFKSTEPFHISALVISSLQTLIHRRREVTSDFENGKTHIALPDRKDDNYWVTLVISNQAIKIPIQGRALLEAESLADFQALMQNAIAIASTSVGWTDFASYVTDNAKFRQDCAYKKGKTLTDKQVRDGLSDPFQIDIADLRIVLNDDQRSTITTVQDDPDAYTGVGTQMVLAVGVNRDQSTTTECSGQVTVKTKHSGTDGANLLDEWPAILDNAVQLSRGASELDALTSGQVPDPKEFRDPRELPPIYTGQVLLNREAYQARINRLYEAYNTAFNVKLSWSLLEALAAMMTVDTEITHFTEAVKKDKSLGVSLIQFTKDVQSAISTQTYDESKLTKFMAELKLWQIDSADAQKGEGLVSVFSVLSQGKKKGIIQPLTELTDRDKVQMLTDSFLFSGFSTRNGYTPASIRENPHSVVQVESFTTAVSDVYPPGTKAVFGVVDRTDGQIAVTIRDYTDDQRHLEQFQANYEKNFAAIMQWLEGFVPAENEA